MQDALHRFAFKRAPTDPVASGGREATEGAKPKATAREAKQTTKRRKTARRFMSRALERSDVVDLPGLAPLL